MQDPTRYEIRLAPQAEAAVRALPPTDRDHLRRVVEGIADLAALAPPLYPGWFKRRNMALPLMRMQLGDLQLSYEINCDDRSIRVCGLERILRQPEELHPFEARSA